MTGKPRTCTEQDCTDTTIARRLCRKHYQAARKAGTLGQYTPQATRPRDRKVCPTEHKHDGSSTCYIQHQCRCDPCMDAHTAMSAKRRREKAYGRFDNGLVDAEPVREHMLMLGEFGLGYKRIAALAGIGITPTRNVLWGRQDPGPRHGEIPRRIRRENAEKILAVKPDLSLLADGASIPSRGTHRRGQALVALGYSQSELGRRLGMNAANFIAMMKRPRVSVGTHRAMVAVFDELCMTVPEHGDRRTLQVYTRSLGYAKARRWLPPLAWDDIDTDPEPAVADDEGGIDEIAVELALAGERVRLTTQERHEAVTRAHARRWSDKLIAATLHVSDRTVQRDREALGLEAYPYEELVQRGAA